MRSMHFTRFIGLTGILAGCGLILAAAPSRPQSSSAVFETPAMPALPTMPAMPALPAMPSMPASPKMPAMPPLPGMPAMPTAPALPPEVPMSLAAPIPPEVPESALLSDHSDAATTCDDLHVVFDGENPVMDSEERTLTKSEASVLHIDNLVNAGVQARGWDKDTYSVTACKFADRKERNAKELLSQIKMSISGGHVSVSGLETNHERWAVQLLVRTPRGANLEIKTQNGPASFSEVDGKIFVRAQNGPVSMSNCTGEADIASQNGPISISGKSGKLKLHTENGPISVALQSPNWTEGGLVADAVNGPVSLDRKSVV